MAYPPTAARTGRTAIIISRGLGVIMVVTSISNGLFLIPQFSSMGLTASAEATPSESYWAYLAPCLFELTVGLVCLLFSRRVGRWLAAGLAD